MVAPPGAGQFDAVDQLHAQRLRGGSGLVEAFKGVVVGQGQDSHAFLERPRHQYRRRQGAIGGRAMAVQINIHRMCNLKSAGAIATQYVCYYAATSCFWLPL